MDCIDGVLIVGTVFMGSGLWGLRSLGCICADCIDGFWICGDCIHGSGFVGTVFLGSRFMGTVLIGSGFVGTAFLGLDLWGLH